jgi:hypothetical protein
MAKKIYLACPYMHPDKNIMQERFEKVNRLASRLIYGGLFVFSPISHTHPIAIAGQLPLGWDFWEPYDRTFIDWCDELHVFKADGWEQSKGVTAEIRIAQEQDKPVIYHEDTFDLSYSPPDPTTLTCFSCDDRGSCEFVNDPYNTGGDCLASK